MSVQVLSQPDHGELLLQEVQSFSFQTPQTKLKDTVSSQENRQVDDLVLSLDAEKAVDQAEWSF